MRHFFLSILICIFAIGTAHAIDNHTAAKQAILMDFETGQVLFEKNADVRMPTSSMSKVMTMYMVFEALKDGRIAMDSVLPVSEKAWRKGGSKMFVEVGARVAVEDLIKGVIVQSGNDATIVLAEGLAGTEEAFAEGMTRRAHAMGMTSSNFVNASGWPDENHYSTARDLATLAFRITQDFPEYYKIYSMKEFTYGGIKQDNRNPLLYKEGLGADGIKTGHTDAGGYGLMASGVRDGRRVILVVNGLESNKDRASESARLLEWGLRGFTNKTLFTAGQPLEKLPVIMGKEDKVAVTIKENLNITVPTRYLDDIKTEVIAMDGALNAPIDKGAEIGKLVVKVHGQEDRTYSVYAAQNIKKLGFFSRQIKNLENMVFGE